MNPPLTHSNPALILSHPGHELRVLGWLGAVRPLVIILTDGAGHTGQPRIDLSRQLIHDAGGRLPEMFGNHTDQEMYQAILDQDLPFFLRLRDQLTGILIANRIDVVAGDSIEGYNPSHDLCRCLIDLSSFEVQKISHRTLLNYEFPLVGHPAAWSERAGAACHRLTDSECHWKLEKIVSYANAVGGKLLEEVNQALAQFGAKVLSEEWFSPPASAMNLQRFEQAPPFYESHGVEQVLVGHYLRPILFRKHLLPLTAALGMDQAA